MYIVQGFGIYRDKPSIKHCDQATNQSAQAMVTACEAETDFPPSEADNTQFCSAKSSQQTQLSAADLET